MAATVSAKHIAIIGMGKMGEAIAQGLMESKLASQYKITGTTRSEESSKEVHDSLKISCSTDNSAAIKGADIVLLAIKPHQVEAVLQTNQKNFRSDQLILSICAAISTDQISEWSGGKAAVIRSMPNTPCLIKNGVTAICKGPRCEDSHLREAEKIFKELGEVTILEESLFDGVTGLSGCGPAYIYLMIEALSEAGVKVGISRKQATMLAAQTMMGAAKMVLDRGEHPASLKDEVTTPAGCTIDGLMALEEGRLRVTLIKAVLAATRRSQRMRFAK
ncbi:MAG: pyrroline-5-carboxylate reductase [Bdellovibrionales bacterium]|nr:pyrroline-5-carboxylate reductase [Bdellovibrionales bacterium]